jgi:tRNA A37 threonylcarbamoyladenosine dehydratase
MKKWTERAELLFKAEGMDRLARAHVLVVGLGGVGSFAAEFLARAGIGTLTIVDGDMVDITNINRQLPALHSTIGLAKVDVVGDRLLDINPNLTLHRIKAFLTPEMAYELVSNEFDFVVDCIDSITPKLNLLMSAKHKKVNIVSSMGAGGKSDASKVAVVDISKTKNDYFAKTIRKRLRKERINKGIKVVYSSELQDTNSLMLTDGQNFKKSFYGTCSYMPGLFGLFCAETVIRSISKIS